MRVKSEIGVKILGDGDGHRYLVEIGQEADFTKWCVCCEEGKFAGMKKFDYFNKCRIDGSLTIFEWEEK